MKRRRRTALILPVLGLCALLLFSAGRISAAGTDPVNMPAGETVAKGVYVGSLDIGGMTRDEAETEVEEIVEAISSAEIVVNFYDEERSVSLSDLGFSWSNADLVDRAMSYGKSGNLLEQYKASEDLSRDTKTLNIEYSWSREKLVSFLEDAAQTLVSEPQNAALTRDSETGECVITESLSTVSVDINATADEIEKVLETGQIGDTVNVEAVCTVLEEPAFTTAMAEEISDVLGEYSTTYDESYESRVKNLVAACGYINGTVLMPGEGLSFHECLYPCTEARGYAKGAAFSNGRVVEAYGGGICQVSTTCYNAVLLAELDVTSRTAHSMLVGYAEPGLDAALTKSGEKDLCFTNSTDYPVYVEAYCEDGTVCVRIWGKETRPENRTVRYGSEYTETWPYSGKVVYTYDRTMAYGETVVTQEEYPKVTARAYKEVLIDGEVVSREYLSTKTDVYTATPSYVTVGTGGLTAAQYKAGVKPETTESN